MRGLKPNVMENEFFDAIEIVLHMDGKSNGMLPESQYKAINT